MNAMIESCLTCKYFRPNFSYLPEEWQAATGICRRHSPTLDQHDSSKYPPTLSNEWCGDYERGDPYGLDRPEYRDSCPDNPDKASTTEDSGE